MLPSPPIIPKMSQYKASLSGFLQRISQVLG